MRKRIICDASFSYECLHSCIRGFIILSLQAISLGIPKLSYSFRTDSYEVNFSFSLPILCNIY